MVRRLSRGSVDGPLGTIAGPDEALIVIEFAGGKGLWCAERLGPGSIRTSRPGYVGEISDVPNEISLSRRISSIPRANTVFPRWPRTQILPEWRVRTLDVG